MMDTWGLKGAGGTGGVTADYDPYRQAFLDTIAAGESPGYDVMYGGKKFTDFSRHPHQAQTANGITSDVPPGATSSSARPGTSCRKSTSYKDFSQANQDAAAWQYAQDIYSQKTNGDKLAEALQSGDPGRMNAAATVLNQTWSSLPGGKEQSKGYGTRTFADVYSGNFGKAGGTPIGGSSGAPASGGAPTADGGGREDLTKLLAGLKKDDTKHNWMTALGEGLSGMKGGSGVKFAGAPSAGPSEAPRVDAPAVSPLAAQDPNKRQYLAALMAQLNSGRLFAG
jgi:muramidase (phage lysozyme)